MKANSGFSLIELLIVVAVIGILAAIAIPNYRDYVIRSKVAEPVATLSSTAAALEQYFQDNRSYAPNCTSGAVVPLPANTDNFDYGCNVGASLYTLTATGKGAMNGFVYVITQNGKSTQGLGAGWTGAPNLTCWVVRNGGGC